MNRHYVLLDACVASAHFASKTTHSKNLRSRSSTLIDGQPENMEVHFLIPNFCIAEVFAVFEKYRWGKTWNKHVKKGNTLTPTEFQNAREAFCSAIHNGSKILQIELDRYHILCVDLIAPINNAYKIKRNRSKKKSVVPAGSYDMLIAAMGIWLNHMYGRDNFTIITGDERLCGVIERAKSVSIGQPLRKHLNEVSKNLGLSYSKDLYPEVINLTKSGKKVLQNRFPDWNPEW